MDSVNTHRLVFQFVAYGHPAILARHPTTLEITTAEHLTAKGDCIVAVRATASLLGLPLEIRRIMASDGGLGRLTIIAGDSRFTVEGRGAAGLNFKHPGEMVVRKSGFASERTLMVRTDKAAVDIPREMVTLLQNPDQEVTIVFSATDGRRD